MEVVRAGREAGRQGRRRSTAKDIQDVEQSGEANIYDPNGRAMKVTFSNLAVGDVVDLTYKLTRLLPTRIGYFNDIFDFQSTEPDARGELHRRRPGDAAADRRRSITAIAARRSSRPRRRSAIACTTRGRVEERAAARARERRWTSRPRCRCSSSRPIRAGSTSRSGGPSSPSRSSRRRRTIKAKVKELTKDAKTDDDKIKALYDFVAQDIRYRGLGVGPRTGYTPRKAERDVHVALGRLPRRLDPPDLDAARERHPGVSGADQRRRSGARQDRVRRLQPRDRRDAEEGRRLDATSIRPRRTTPRCCRATKPSRTRWCRRSRASRSRRSPRSIRARTSATRSRPPRSPPTAR